MTMKTPYTLFVAVLLYNVLIGQVQPRLVVPTKQLEAISALAVSPDGQFIASGYFNSHIHLKTTSGQLVQNYSLSKTGSFDPASAIHTIFFLPDGRHIAAFSNKIGRVFQLDGTVVYEYFNATGGNIASAACSGDGGSIFIGLYSGELIQWNLQQDIRKQVLKDNSAIQALACAPNTPVIFVGTAAGGAWLYNFSGALISDLSQSFSSVSSAAFSSKGGLLAVGGVATDSLTDLEYDSGLVQVYRSDGQALAHFYDQLDISHVSISGNGQNIVTQGQTGTSGTFGNLWTIGQTNGQDVGDITCSTFMPDGHSVLIGNKDADWISRYDMKGQLLENIAPPRVSGTNICTAPNGRFLVTYSADVSSGFSWTDFINTPYSNVFQLWDLEKNTILPCIGKTGIQQVFFAPDGQSVITFTTAEKYERWNLNGQLIGTIAEPVSTQAIYDLSAENNPQRRFHLSDGTYGVSIAEGGQDIARIITYDSLNWVVTTPEGLFDASPGAMQQLHYILGLEVIELEQLKERYYEPGLLPKLLGYAEGGLRPVQDLNNLALYPKIANVSIDGDQLRLKLEPRNGGLGKVVLLLDDNIELDPDINPQRKSAFSVDLSQYTGQLFPDKTNRLSIRSYNSEGWLKGPVFQFDYQPTGVLDRGQSSRTSSLRKKSDQDLEKITLYALVVGTSTYRGEKLNLRYPDKDATVFADALQQSSSALFQDQVEITTLTTQKEPWPRKQQVRAALADIATKADPNDILLVYLSGHGITYPPNSEKGRFFYLTTDILGDKLDDPATLSEQAIAQDSLQEWIRQIAARKRILILDACNSGRVVETLEVGGKDLNADQRRALERMKDRSGMFVLAGSAADKSSFEASRFGHGLLTYSLLRNMPVVAANNKTLIDAGKLFQNVRDDVPKLARDIGRVQAPELIGAESFDIGLVNATVRIEVPQAKPVFIKTNFLNSRRNKDTEQLSKALNSYLDQRSSEKNPALVFWNVDEFTGVHYYLGGQYQLADNIISGSASLYLQDKELSQFEFSSPANDLDLLTDTIMGKAIQALNTTQN